VRGEKPLLDLAQQYFAFMLDPTSSATCPHAGSSQSCGYNNVVEGGADRPPLVHNAEDAVEDEGQLLPDILSQEPQH
jgi:hypothetical protein